MRRSLLGLLPCIVFLAAWTVGSSMVASGALPGPLPIAWALLEELTTSKCWIALGATSLRTLMSFVIAALLGIGLGIIPGRPGPLRDGTEAVIDFLRSIPGPALLPIFMTLFGLYAGPKIALAVFVCSLINAVYAGTGIRMAGRSPRVLMAESFGASRRTTFWKVIFPSALELIISGLRVTLSLALVLSVLAELVLMTGNGIGVLIRVAYEDRKVAEMYATIILSGGLGMLFNKAFVLAERSMTWYGRAGVLHGRLRSLEINLGRPTATRRP